MRVPVAVPMTGGINLFQDPADIKDDEVVRCKNIYPKSPGHMATRPSSSVPGSVASAASNGVPIGMQFLPINAPARFILLQRGVNIGGLQYNTFMAAYPDVTGGLTALLASADFGCVTPYAPALISYKGKVYAFGGYGCNSVGKYLQKKADGSGNVEIVDFAFSTTGNESIRPHVVGNYRERFVYCNLGPGFESAFTFADPFDPSTITANALSVNGGYSLVNPDDGDRITACFELIQTGGTDIQSTFLLLKEWSAFLLSGEPVFSDGTGPDNLQTMKLPVNCGCSSQATVCRTPFGVIWAGPDDVWFFPEGQLPYRVGTKIRPVLQATPANVRYRWHAVFHDGFYKLSLFGAGQGPTDDSPCGESYWLDMRSGMPQNSPEAWREARWYGPMVHTFQNADGTPEQALGTRCLAIDVRPGADRSLWDAQMGDGSLASTIYMVSMGGNGSHDSVFEYDPGTKPVATQTTEIAVEIITKNFKQIVSNNQLVADSIQEKGLHGVELDLEVSAGGQLGWQWITNTKTTGAEQTVEVLPSQGFLLGTGVLDTDALGDDDTRITLDPAPTRVNGYALQLKIYNKPGYYIDSTNDMVVMDVEVTPGVIVRVDVPLDQGFYATRAALATAVAAKLTAALAAYAVVISASLPTYYVCFTNGSGNELQFGASHTQVAYKAKVRALALLLGFSDWEVDYEGLATVTATEAVYTHNAQTWEIKGGMILHLYTIPRRLL